MATIPRAASERRETPQGEPRRTDEELVETSEFLHNVFESSTQHSIIAKDLQRRIMAWNKGAARIYGYDASEVIGHAPRPGGGPVVRSCAHAEGHATGLFRRRCKDGSEFLARLTITRRNDAQGKP